MQTELSVVLGVCHVCLSHWKYIFSAELLGNDKYFQTKRRTRSWTQMGEERRKLNTFYRLDSLGKKDPVPSIVLNVSHQTLVLATERYSFNERQQPIREWENGGWYVYNGVADKEQISKWQCLRFPRRCDKEFLNCFVSHTHSHVDNRQSTAHEVADVSSDSGNCGKLGRRSRI